MRIAVDAMGGDHAPATVIEGACCAVAAGVVTPGALILVGRAEDIEAELAKLDPVPDSQRVTLQDLQASEVPASDADRFLIVDAREVVEMDEAPAVALRQKRDSSMNVATGLVKHGIAQALVSAGNTGAVVASAVTQLKSLDGVHRPGIAVVIEGEAGPFVVIDVGANIAPKPMHLLHYAVMGQALMRKAHGKERPKVALLNIGGEAGKGNMLAKEAQSLISQADINYVGNIEGQDVFLGVSDVIVTEGFVGNVVLKLSEGLAKHLLHVAHEELTRAGVDPHLVKSSLGAILRRTDYSEYGGALLLGVEGIVTICHGRSDGRAIKNAIRLAREAVEVGINETIVTDIKAF
ncbi:MAG: phosphate--acyl-ACP acyltransferase [Planctomycetota bacterium]|nr:MAG: phosphate--acyl-ACP acyltransferase [Planctomycetota bacterium]